MIFLSPELIKLHVNISKLYPTHDKHLFDNLWFIFITKMGQVRLWLIIIPIREIPEHVAERDDVSATTRIEDFNPPTLLRERRCFRERKFVI